MKKIMALMFVATLVLCLVACGSGETVDTPTNSSNESDIPMSVPSDSSISKSPLQQTEESNGSEADTTENSANVDIMPDDPTRIDIMSDDDWEVQMEDADIVDGLKEAFITSWNNGRWSMRTTWSAVGDEVLKDVVIFKSTKQGEYSSEYYCLIYASVHLQEKYRNDGSTYYSFSDKDSELVDIYMYSSISTDSTFLLLDMNGSLTRYEDVIDKIKTFCGENLISVLNINQRLALIDATTENKEASELYAKMEALLKAHNFVDAQQLYYKTNGLTYSQSRKCLLLLTKYELLFFELSPIQGLVDVSGTFTLNSYTLNSWQDKDYSDDENDLIIYVEYHCKITHPIMGTKTYQDNLTIPITLDVEGKTFVKRS